MHKRLQLSSLPACPLAPGCVLTCRHRGRVCPVQRVQQRQDLQRAERGQQVAVVARAGAKAAVLGAVAGHDLAAAAAAVGWAEAGPNT